MAGTPLHSKEFAETARRVLIELANEASADLRNDSSVHRLAGHLYAVTSVLANRFGQSRLRPSGPSTDPEDPTPKLVAILSDIASLPAGLSGNGLYWKGVTFLTQLDSFWGELVDYSIFHTPLRGLEKCGIHGEVTHWFRPKSSLRHLRRNREQKRESAPPPEPAPEPHDSLHRLSFLWNSDPRRPEVSPPQLETDLSHSLFHGNTSESIAETGYRIALCPLVGSSEPRFELTTDCQRFRARHVTERDEYVSQLNKLIQAAANRKVEQILLPELMVDELGRKAIEASLYSAKKAKPLGIVAGSFHFESEEGKHVNESVLYSRKRRIELQHHKRGFFRVTRAGFQLGASRYFLNGPQPPEELPPGVSTIVEEIEAVSSIQFLETSLGRMMIAICADCIALDETAIESELHRLRPDLLLVVSMTPETNPFEEKLSDLAKRGISSFFVNAFGILGSHSPAGPSSAATPLLASAHLGIFEPSGAPPTRIAWRLGKDRPQVRMFSGRHAAKGWHDLPADQEGPWGIDWLRVDGTPVGLLIDLGPHFRWRSRTSGTLTGD